jgi:23S rRNA maturation mini-RNase III
MNLSMDHEFGLGAMGENIDLEEERNPRRRKRIHHASHRVSERAAADQELIISLSNELESAMRQLQESNVALDIVTRSKNARSRRRATGTYREATGEDGAGPFETQ